MTTSKSIQKKWNERYLSDASEAPRPAWVLDTYRYLLPEHGVALDLACGLGGNAVFLAQRGLSVSAWDLSDVAIRALQMYSLSHNLPIDARVRDVIANPPSSLSHDVIVVSYFLHLPLFQHLVEALRPGGLVFYQTFSAERPAGFKGPSNPDFLLQKNELLEAFSELDVLAFHDEGLVGDLSRGLRGESAIVAMKPHG